MWSAPSKSRFYYLFWLLELMPGHLRRSILRILVLNPTHEISWSRSGFFSLRGRILRAGPRAPLCFLVFVFSPSLTASVRTLRRTGHATRHTKRTCDAQPRQTEGTDRSRATAAAFVRPCVRQANAVHKVAHEGSRERAQRSGNKGRLHSNVR